jgi:hypothetical protein
VELGRTAGFVPFPVTVRLGRANTSQSWRHNGKENKKQRIRGLYLKTALLETAHGNKLGDQNMTLEYVK